MFGRLYPVCVSLMGAAGLATTLAYFGGVYLAFEPGWQGWAQFFVPAALPLLLIPCTLLVGYLYLRTRLGRWYLGRGRVDEAIAYCQPRLTHHLGRGTHEALINRLTLARAHIKRGAYDTAEALLGSGYARPQKGAIALDIQRWRMEAALRRRDLLVCRQAYDAVDGLARPKAARGYLEACRAELALRQRLSGPEPSNPESRDPESSDPESNDFESNDQPPADAYADALATARWCLADDPRIELVEDIGALRLRAPETEPTDARSADAQPALASVAFDRSYGDVVDQIPARQSELFALQAQVLYIRGDADAGGRLLQRARQAPTDDQSDHEIERASSFCEST